MELKETIYTDCNGKKCLLDNGQMRYNDDTGKPLFENTILANEKTLRDWFAGQAVIGLIISGKQHWSGGEIGKGDPVKRETVAFSIANAMLEERNK